MTPTELESQCRRIRLVVTDVDGVLTDGGMYYDENGGEWKKFNVRDGAGVALLKLAGLTVGALTGETTRMVVRRMEKIGADFLIEGARDKLAALTRYTSENGFELAEVAYIGDEINDCCLLGRVGLFFAIADACHDVLSHADYVLQTRGGQGALREAASLILTSQGKYELALERYQSISGNHGAGSSDQPRCHQWKRDKP